ncbi:MAG TPA: hypothetical protein DCS15_09280 [Flavobacteriales bacterium]|nr:hypothetical protein [Flavobacteriales bacterium]
MSPTEIQYGRIKKWFDEKGFGFITYAQKDEPFVHIKNVAENDVKEGDWVTFSLRPSRRKPGSSEAFNVSAFRKLEQATLIDIVHRSCQDNEGDVDFKPFGFEALGSLKPDIQGEVLNELFEKFHDQSWSKAAKSFYDSGKKSISNQITQNKLESNSEWLNTDEHFRFWSQGRTAVIPTAGVIVSQLLDGFSQESTGNKWGSRDYPNPLHWRLGWIELVPEFLFDEVMTQVDQIRSTLDAKDWVLELQELLSRFKTEDSRKAKASLTQEMVLESMEVMDRIQLQLEHQIGRVSIDEYGEQWLIIDSWLREKFERQSTEQGIDVLGVLEKSIEFNGLTIELVKTWVPFLNGTVAWKGVLDDRLAASLNIVDRADLFLNDDLGILSQSEFVSCWIDLDARLQRVFKSSIKIEDEFRLEVFLGSLDKDGLTGELIDSWRSLIIENESWQFEIERRAKSAAPQELFELWVAHLVARPSREAFLWATGSDKENNLGALRDNANRLEFSEWAPLIQRLLEDAEVVKSRAEFAFVRELLAIAGLFQGAPETLDFRHKMVDANGRLVHWARSESEPWVGNELLREVLPVADVALHVDVARKFFLHVRRNEIAERHEVLREAIEICSSDFVPFAERATWKIIGKLVHEDEWMRFEDLIGEYVQNSAGWPQDNADVWPLLDKCIGRTTLDFSGMFKLEYEDDGWSDRSRSVQINFDGVFVYSAYEDRYEVRKIPGIRWRPERKAWRTDLSNADAAIEKGRELGYAIRDKGNFWENNSHLPVLENNYSPITTGDGKHCIRCAGRKSPKLDLGKPFWWCQNAKCFEAAHSKERSWTKSTLLDFLRDLEIEVDDRDTKGELVVDGMYQRLSGAINRFLQLYKRLECGWRPGNWEKIKSCAGVNSTSVGCGELMHPHGHSHYAFYRVTHFACSNEQCGKHEEEVYLHHCLNGDCMDVIDSRFSAQCPNGWYICRSCGSCCSDEAISRRKGIVGGNRLMDTHKNNEGVQEKAFCACCGSEKDKEENEVSEGKFGGKKKEVSFRCVNTGCPEHRTS